MPDVAIPLGEKPRSILVITLRRLGDVLLTTPLVRTLRHSWPDIPVDLLVFRGTEGMLAGNPDIREVVTLSEKPSLGEFLGLARRLWRRYDLAVTTQAGDRPTLLAWIAGRRRIGIVKSEGIGDTVKRRLLHRSVETDLGIHRVVELLRLSDALGLPQHPRLVCPQGRTAAAPQTPYAVLHPNPKFRYRRWNAEGWRGLTSGLRERGLSAVVTGAADAAERAYLDELWGPVSTSIIRMDGKLDWPQLAALIGGAEVYIGPDTSMTHLAAGTGCPTVAIYGPASPTVIGPWPAGGLQQPWAPSGTIQRRGNVFVVQNPLPCLPCDRLGCDSHLSSRAQCLDELTAAQVLMAVDAALKIRTTPAASKPAAATVS